MKARSLNALYPDYQTFSLNSEKFAKLVVIPSGFPADLVTFTEEFLTGKHHFLCSVETYLKNYHKKSSYIKSRNNLIFFIPRSN